MRFFSLNFEQAICQVRFTIFAAFSCRLNPSINRSWELDFMGSEGNKRVVLFHNIELLLVELGLGLGLEE